MVISMHSLGKCLKKWLPQCLLNSKSLEFSRIVKISHLYKRAEACSLLVNTEVFNTIHRKRHRFPEFFGYFLKHIKMYIEWTGIVKPVPESST